MKAKHLILFLSNKNARHSTCLLPWSSLIFLLLRVSFETSPNPPRCSVLSFQQKRIPRLSYSTQRVSLRKWRKRGKFRGLFRPLTQFHARPSGRVSVDKSQIGRLSACVSQSPEVKSSESEVLPRDRRDVGSTRKDWRPRGPREQKGEIEDAFISVSCEDVGAHENTETRPSAPREPLSLEAFASMETDLPRKSSRASRLDRGRCHRMETRGPMPISQPGKRPNVKRNSGRGTPLIIASFSSS